MLEYGEQGETGETGANSDDYAELLEILKREEQQSAGFETDQVYEDQIKAFERYTGQDYGDEQPGRSAVHDRTIFETIEWMRPDLSRVFASGGNSVIVEPWAEGTHEAAEQASDYLNHMFFEDMDGEDIIDSFAFDGLLQKRGHGAVYWEPEQLGPPETAQLDQMGMQQLEASGVEILGVEPNEDGMSANVTFQRTIKPAKPIIQIIAPEDFRISARSVTLDRPRYCGHRERIMKTDLIEEFPDQADKIRDYAHEEETLGENELRAARFFDEDDWRRTTLTSDGDDLTAEVVLWREYIYHDQNGDGYAELLEVFRLGECVLTVQEVEDNPYFSWTPIPIPHRWYGLSIYDVAKDIQKMKTALLRGALDSVYLSVAPRQIANKNVNLSDLLTVRPGAIVRTNSTNPVNQDVTPLITPDLSASALAMMEAVDQMGERRTGISRNAQGMDPDTLNKTATGIKLMQNAASIRKEQIARNLGRGVEMMFRKMYRLIVQNTAKPQSVHMGKGKFREFDPSQWAPEAKIRIHVGNGTGDRETQLNQRMMLLGLQREWVANFGPGNPIVGVKQLHAMVEDIGRIIGLRSVDQYFTDPESVDPQAMQQLMAPKPDPKMEEAKAKLQMDQQKMQFDQQAKQAEMQANMQAEQQKLAAQAQADQQKMAVQAETDAARMQMEADLKREQMAMEIQLKREQLAAELELKREQMIAELQIKRELGLKAAASKPNGSGTSGVHMGGEPG
ncbi:MAG: hypothetical protein EP341_03140 [Sphingomonadales bacterium]|nr:MAG: hypothetical protein EP341_03140 [Sphingomonadales bacterium]